MKIGEETVYISVQGLDERLSVGCERYRAKRGRCAMRALVTRYESSDEVEVNGMRHAAHAKRHAPSASCRGKHWQCQLLLIHWGCSLYLC